MTCGVGQTYRHVDRIGVYLGDSDGDPYFNGLGPRSEDHALNVQAAWWVAGMKPKIVWIKIICGLLKNIFGASIIPRNESF
ncbi:MAG: hypothetical protein IPM92_08005 [Saprospiraceae bacterium]|nr:hypothetical protein [Saprospiraceae bacterium]